jgi:nitroreductase
VLVKPAETAYPLHDLIRSRWSPRAFADRPVDAGTLGSLLEAARWAPSSYNEQPWRFLVATKDDPAEFDRMLGCLVEGNQTWAKAAPVLMLSTASLRFARNGKPNPHAWHDVGLASANLVVQATAMGLVCHGMAGYNASQARAVYGIPDGFDVVAAWAVGYQGDPDSLPEQLRDRERDPRQRKPLSEMVYSGGWERTAAFVTQAD